MVEPRRRRCGTGDSCPQPSHLKADSRGLRLQSERPGGRTPLDSAPLGVAVTWRLRRSYAAVTSYPSCRSARGPGRHWQDGDHQGPGPGARHLGREDGGVQTPSLPAQSGANRHPLRPPIQTSNPTVQSEKPGVRMHARVHACVQAVTEQDRTGQDRTGQNRTDQNRTEQHFPAPGCDELLPNPAPLFRL